jgi:hypothetical protein
MYSVAPGCKQFWRGWWSAYRMRGEPLLAKSPELPELGFIPTPPPSKGGALARLVVPSDLRSLHICVFGRWAGATFLWIFAVFWCGSASYLAGRGSLGAFPWDGLYR